MDEEALNERRQQNYHDILISLGEIKGQIGIIHSEVSALKERVGIQNGRVSTLENTIGFFGQWKAKITGGVIVFACLNLPLIIYVIQEFIHKNMVLANAIGKG